MRAGSAGRARRRWVGTRPLAHDRVTTRRGTVIVPGTVHATIPIHRPGHPITCRIAEGTPACRASTGSRSRRSPARRASPSQTVSRVINKRPDVSPETRAAVEAAIARHGFQPSAVARSLVRRRSADDRRHRRGAQLLRRGPDAQRHRRGGRGRGLLDHPQGAGELRRPATSCPVVEFFIAHRVEGIIFAPPQMGANIRHVHGPAAANGPPVVFLKAEPTAEFTTIGIDNQRRRAPGDRAPARARAHADRAHRGAARLARGPRSPRRLAGRARGARAGARADDVAAWSSEGGADAFARLLDEDPAIDALFCASDQIALGALHVANARGIRIPDQVAVVGFDGLPEARAVHPVADHRPAAARGARRARRPRARRGGRRRGRAPTRRARSSCPSS